MRLQIFAELALINAAEDWRDTSKRGLTIGPGAYDIEKVDNPVFGSDCGGPWYVLKGTVIGLPVTEFERRLQMVDTCQLRVQISS